MRYCRCRADEVICSADSARKLPPPEPDRKAGDGQPGGSATRIRKPFRIHRARLSRAPENRGHMNTEVITRQDSADVLYSLGDGFDATLGGDRGTKEDKRRQVG